MGAVGTGAIAIGLVSCDGGGGASDGSPLTGMGGDGGAGAGVGGSPGGGGGGWWSVLPVAPWREVAPPLLDASGGAADVPGGQGQGGGLVHLTSTGGISIVAAWPLPAPPDVPAAPGDAQAVGSDALGGDVALPGSIHLSGDLTTGGAEPVRIITAQSGDLFVSGKLRGGDLGGARQGITLNAPQGTVYVSGAIDTSGADGQSGGAIQITAQRIVVTGLLSSAGGNGVATGGAAGPVTLLGLGDVIVAGHLRLRGGGAISDGADAQGGGAATLTIDAPGTVQIAGALDARGGFAQARAPGGVVVAGSGGTVRVGASTVPANVELAVPVVLTGGSGGSVAGPGGTLTLEGRGHFRLAANVTAAGGSIVGGGAGEGGPGGTFNLEIASVIGDVTVEAGAVVNLDGGRSAGAAKAGGGGKLTWRSWDGTVSMAGTIQALGGNAPDPGGEGGLGGHVYLLSDANYDGIGGNLTIEPTGLIDVSGGPGTIGGSARNDGTWDVAVFPDGLEMIAVLLNSDGRHGTPQDGVTVNLGRIVARGGATNGNGGDIQYHGQGLERASDPEPGNVDTAGDGMGMPGQVLME